MPPIFVSSIVDVIYLYSVTTPANSSFFITQSLQHTWINDGSLEVIYWMTFQFRKSPGVKMSCMKNLVLSEPVVDIVDPKTIVTSNCVVKVSPHVHFLAQWLIDVLNNDTYRFGTKKVRYLPYKSVELKFDFSRKSMWTKLQLKRWILKASFSYRLCEMVT